MYTVCEPSVCPKLLEDFIEEFFYQNPISQLGVIITRNKRAEKISDLAGNSRKHIKVITYSLNCVVLFKYFICVICHEHVSRTGTQSLATECVDWRTVLTKFFRASNKLIEAITVSR